VVRIASAPAPLYFYSIYSRFPFLLPSDLIDGCINARSMVAGGKGKIQFSWSCLNLLLVFLELLLGAAPPGHLPSHPASSSIIYHPFHCSFTGRR
jgi:hypothetical protein